MHRQASPVGFLPGKFSASGRWLLGYITVSRMTYEDLYSGETASRQRGSSPLEHPMIPSTEGQRPIMTP